MMNKRSPEENKLLLVTMDPVTMTVACTGSHLGLQFLQHKPVDTDCNVSGMLQRFLADHYKATCTKVSIVEKHFGDLKTCEAQDRKPLERNHDKKRKKISEKEEDNISDDSTDNNTEARSTGRLTRSGRRIKIPKRLDGWELMQGIKSEENFDEVIKPVDEQRQEFEIKEEGISKETSSIDSGVHETNGEVTEQGSIFVCRKCDVKAETEIDRLHHEVIVHDYFAESFEIHPINKTLKCPICKTVRKSEDTMKLHIQEHYETDPKELTCKICNLECKTKHRLQSHVLIHNEAEYPCKICRKKFRTDKYVRRHMLEFHKVSSIDDKGDDNFDDVNVQNKLNALVNLSQTDALEHDGEADYHKNSVDGNEAIKDIQDGGVLSDSIDKVQDEIQDNVKEQNVKESAKDDIANAEENECKHSTSDPELQNSENQDINDELQSEKPTATFLSCKFCSQKFSKKFNLTRHIVRKHKNKIDVKVENSVTVSQDGESYQCELCDVVLYSLIESVRHQLDVHDLVVLEADKDIFKCPICKISRKSTDSMKLHIQEHFQTDNSELTCKICGLQLKTKHRLNNHILIHNEAKFPCPLCGKRFRMMKYVRRHMKETHKKSLVQEDVPCNTDTEGDKGDIVAKGNSSKPKKQTPGICDVCGKAFRTKSTMLNHRTIHFEEKPYKCSKCDKTFRLQSSLRNHSMIHKEAKNFICEQCGKSFKISQGLRMHTLRHHDKVDYKCDLCDRKFLSFGGKKYHILKEHKELVDNLGLKLFPCKYCSRVSASYQEFLRHESTHVDNRSHVCEICNGRWATASQLNVHKKSHFGINKKFTCSICDFKTTTPWKLKRHLASTKHLDNCQAGGHNINTIATDLTPAETSGNTMTTNEEIDAESNVEGTQTFMEIDEVKRQGQGHSSSDPTEEVEVKYFEVSDQIILTEDNGVVFSVNGLELEGGTYIYDPSINQAVESILKLQRS